MARAEGLQPVLDEVLEAAKRLCDAEHAQLFMAEGDLLVIVSTIAALNLHTSTPLGIHTRRIGEA